MTDLASSAHERLLALSQQYLSEIDEVLLPPIPLDPDRDADTTPPDMGADWRRRANCMGADPDLFFPERGGDYKQAKAICSTCEVCQECLEDAIERREKFGIWGGTSERDRRRIRRRRSLLGRLGMV